MNIYTAERGYGKHIIGENSSVSHYNANIGLESSKHLKCCSVTHFLRLKNRNACVKSKLFALSSIQSISKKAIVTALSSHYGLNKLPEDGAEYSVEITQVNRGSEQKSMVIRVTDERLIAKTGGIVQGMSGSPIVQNGKLVGAVTHVLVNDPTRGYGIFIENMLDAAG